MGPKRRGKKTDDLQEQERKRQRSERTLYWLITGNEEAPVTRGVASCNQEAGRTQLARNTVNEQTLLQLTIIGTKDYIFECTLK